METHFNNKQKQYTIKLDNQIIGTSLLELADAPMGVVFGKIEFINIDSPYELIKSYCAKNNITVNFDDPEVRFIDTQNIPNLKVYNEQGKEINGLAGSSISGMVNDGYEITILGIPYPFFEEEFPHHVKDYQNSFK